MTQASSIKQPLKYAEYKEFNLDKAKLCRELVCHACKLNEQVKREGKGRESALQIPEEIQGSKFLWGHAPFAGNLGAEIYNYFYGKDAISALFGYVYKDKKGSIYVVFRGTDYGSEWYNNFYPDMEPCKLKEGKDLGKVHWGFYSIYKTIREALMKTLDEYQKASPQCSEIYFTGHSLGGALSTLAMLDVMNNFVMPMSPQQRPKMVQYAFGSPKVGNKQFAEAFNSEDVSIKCFQIINTVDIVPSIPIDNLMSIATLGHIFLNPLTSVTHFLNRQTYENHGELVKFTIDCGDKNKNHDLWHTYREPLES